MEHGITGIFIGAFITTVFNFAIFNERVNAHDHAIESCEKGLPRNQTCVITAIVKESE